MDLWTLVIGIVGGVLLLWVALVAALWVGRPDQMSLGEALRLLPDLVRLLRRLGADTSLPRGVRWRIWFLLGYLAMPIDLVPDFIPVLGYADDAIMVALVLRSVVRRAGPDVLELHWSGSPAGLAGIMRLIDRSG